MRKVIIIPIIVIAVIILGFSFIPMLEKYHLYSFDQRVERELGEGQKFTDATGKRCLMSDTIAGDKCPIGSKGYNPDTKVYDTGVSGMAQLNAKLGGYSDPYDPSSFDRMDAMLGMPENNVNPFIGDWWKANMYTLNRYIDGGKCTSIMDNITSLTDFILTHPKDENRDRNMNMLEVYETAYDENCE